jgi:hypothetical protein
MINVYETVYIHGYNSSQDNSLCHVHVCVYNSIVFHIAEDMTGGSRNSVLFVTDVVIIYRCVCLYTDGIKNVSKDVLIFRISCKAPQATSLPW